MIKNNTATKSVTQRCRVCRSTLSTTPLIQYENMPCSAQAFPTLSTLAQDHGTALKISQCASCGLVQLIGKPVPYYREVIRATAFSAEMREFRRQQFSAWTNEFDLHGKKVLEIGCGRGEYLTLLAEAGLQAHGIEYAAKAVKACQTAGLKVERTFLSRPIQTLTSAPFDAFCSFNFMEHWPDPINTLHGMANNLVEGGLGLVEVPNFDMILKHGLYAEFISDHLSYFTRETFTSALQLSGFEVLRCTSIWHDYILSAIVRKRAPLDTTLLHQRRSQVTQALHDFIASHAAQGIAGWGAGHQALATIALTGIAPSLRYIIDSAPFKQGKLTPATHLRIVAPEQLVAEPVAAIIVMAAAYSDEVARIIRQRFDQNITVAILRDAGLEQVS